MHTKENKLNSHRLLQANYNYTDEELFEAGLPEISDKSFEIARHVLSTVGSVIGLLPSEKPSLHDNFFDIGGNSINAVLTLAKLNDIGFKINIEQEKKLWYFCYCCSSRKATIIFPVKQGEPRFIGTSKVGV